MDKLKELKNMLNEKELYKIIYSFFFNEPMILLYEIDYDTQEIEIPINTNSNFKIIFENDIEEETTKHKFEKKGIYEIKIFGNNITYLDYSKIPFYLCKYLKEVITYGSLILQLEIVSFKRCNNLIKVPNELPEKLISTYEMFSGAIIFNQNISQFKMQNIINANSMFENSKSFNKDISNWDTSNLIDTCNMFDGAIKFNCDISQWNLKNVINYKYMFLGCHIDESKKPIIV